MDLAKIKFGKMSALVIQGSDEFKNRVRELNNKEKGLIILSDTSKEQSKTQTQKRDRSERKGVER